jgi:uncharacterized protein YceK
MRIGSTLTHLCVMSVVVMGLTVVSGCMSIPTDVSGVYHYGFEENSLRSQDYPDETWWVESTAILERMEEAIPPDAFGYGAGAFVRVYGMRSGRREFPAYGHCGLYDRSFQVLEIIDIRPVTEDDLRSVGFSAEDIERLGGKRDGVHGTPYERRNTGG